jgi:hypothetical protein
MSVPAKKRFAQVYPQGWQTIRSLGENPTALRVYTFIAEHCDHLNALVCPVEVLADELGVNERTVYILDPNDVWKNYERYKGYCAFHGGFLAPPPAWG